MRDSTNASQYILKVNISKHQNVIARYISLLLNFKLLYKCVKFWNCECVLKKLLNVWKLSASTAPYPSQHPPLLQTGFLA